MTRLGAQQEGDDMRQSARTDRTTVHRVQQFLSSIAAAGVEVPELTAAAVTEGTLVAWIDEVREQQRATKSGNLISMSAEAVVAAASAGEKRPAGYTANLIEAEQRERTLALEERVLVHAHDAAALELAGMVDDSLIPVLQPVHEDILEAVRKLEPTLRATPVDDAEAILAGTSKLQHARAELLGLRRRWDALRAAWSVLVDEDVRQSDHALWRDPAAVWGSSFLVRRQSRPPWPEGQPLAWLLFYATTPGEPWLPTPDELRAREAEVFAAAKAERAGAGVAIGM
jgi:hypothetical protein